MKRRMIHTILSPRVRFVGASHTLPLFLLYAHTLTQPPYFRLGCQHPIPGQTIKHSAFAALLRVGGGAALRPHALGGGLGAAGRARVVLKRTQHDSAWLVMRAKCIEKELSMVTRDNAGKMHAVGREVGVCPVGWDGTARDGTGWGRVGEDGRGDSPDECGGTHDA